MACNQYVFQYNEYSVADLTEHCKTKFHPILEEGDSNNGSLCYL